MIEFVIKNRRLRLYPDGDIGVRTIYGKKETKQESWTVISFNDNGYGYLKTQLTVEGKYVNLYRHRLVYLAENPDWDIFKDKMIYKTYNEN